VSMALQVEGVTQVWRRIDQRAIQIEKYHAAALT